MDRFTRRALHWVLAALLLTPATMRAQEYLCATNADNSITILQYTGNGGDLVIPETFTGRPVTCIGDDAFNLNSDLSRVTIPNTVTNIGVDAFSECDGLTNVVIGSGVVAIGALTARARGIVVVQRLRLGAAGGGERGLGIQHVQLCAGPGTGAGMGFAQRFFRFILDGLLRFQNLLCADEVGIGCADLQLNLAGLLFQGGF